MILVTECGSLQALKTLRSEWDDLMARSDNASIFTGWEWTDAAWRSAVPGKKPFVLVARTGEGRLLGVMPLARSSRFRLLRMVEVLGCSPTGYPMGDYGGMMAERGVEAPVWSAMLRKLRESRWSMIDLRNCMVPTAARGESPYARTPFKNWDVTLLEADTCRRLELAPTFDAYLGGLSSNSRQNIRRKLRKLAEDGHQIEVVNPDDEQARNEALNAVFRYHQEKWADDPSGGAFRGENLKEMHRHLGRVLAGSGKLDLRVVRSADGDIAGVIYNFRQNGTGYYYQLGFSQAEQWRPYSLGVCLLADSIKGAIDAGCTTFDLLRGDHDYKRHFGGTVHRNVRVTIYRHGWLPALEGTARKLKRRVAKGPAAHASVTA